MNLINLSNHSSENWRKEELSQWEAIVDVDPKEQVYEDTVTTILAKAMEMVSMCEAELTVPTYNWKICLTRGIDFELAYTFCELWQKKHPEVDIVLPVAQQEPPFKLTYREL